MDRKEDVERVTGEAAENGLDTSEAKGRDKNGAPIPPPKESGFPDFFALLIIYIVMLFGVYGVLSFISPEILVKLWGNLVGTFGILTLGFTVLFAFAKGLESLSSSSFVEIDRKARGDSKSIGIQLGSFALNTFIKNFGMGRFFPFDIDFGDPKTYDPDKTNARIQDRAGVGDIVERQKVLGTAFEMYICSVVESLDKHISLTEEKGSNLLDRGLLFLFGGILYYIIAIALWQIWAKYGEPKDSVMYIGMFASSVVFLVCEFLAAWFLKQYRHYVDASLACLRVKSVYDRYMLSYYAVKEMGSEGDGVSEKLSRVLEAIKEDVMWPGHKDNLSNDFNYMLETMSSVHTSLDKLKGLFDSKTKPAGADSKPDDK
jgi:hypothetical protein